MHQNHRANSPDITRRRASRNGVIIFEVVMFVLGSGLSLGVFSLVGLRVGLLALLISVLIGLVCASSIHMVLQWEKAVILRFGKFSRTSGPGLVFTLPIIEYCTLRIDQRVATAYFGAEETLTSDLVPVNVDAVLFWMVFDPEKACNEVEDYASAVTWVAQTAMRKAIGRNTVAEVAAKRDQIDEELREEIEEKLAPWGIDIIGVEVRDIVIPHDLQEAMSRQAIAEREREARMVLAEAESDIAAMLSDASKIYDDDERAMRLRTMHLAYESVKASGGTVVLPSSFSEGFVDPKGNKN
ncbi:SPFH domain-containing protein [Cryptobacterium curtum]|uniref:SPFH domain-containing protein n=1 Tax=Cryptobacterium curtum TaxID=84163 RepID=UPI0028D81739|nr:SPFH domain-containing protein [Cryptobacterium curtum]